jgi:hypothetical protein
VFLAGTSTLATLYADAAGVTPKGNPFVSNADGLAYFFVSAPGTYDLLIQKGGFEDKSVPGVLVSPSETIANAERTVAVDTAILNSDYAVFADLSGGNRVFTLALLADMLDGQEQIFGILPEDVSGNTLTLQPQGGEPIDNLADLELTIPGERVRLMRAGAKYRRVG